ncbi:hypothetical protein PC129_g9803 [Phytophthora cactorum]|uniref:Uncharacterized protein n=1 Tax=Phytophthora cactorum TaxID=29920 RepID=A0A8T1I3A6_9STRA|nr:hypothetical protein Pcac1_g3048 [Phytophthora cactorum]KAG2793202.1 hypothetical protein PC112_g23544 [Phytophthora cactorum]KAG2835645.1 hypothetical protein PC111_g5345 [Phytophthora cactorum]KAG2864336.1 hypothetical protein PC113_g4656 [Phytophthora cactorum]KAG2901904.1 hypothetical protein PC114_g12953 [Phytophthora cactorum]
MQLWIDWVESLQLVYKRVVDLERQVAQLHGQLISLLRLQQFAPRPVASPSAVDQSPAAPPLHADPALTPRRSPEQGPGMA